MRTDSIKKYVIPNIPYLFILWACLKLGTAYRLAPGADFAHKLMGLGQSIGPAFADFAPGLHPLDWLIGIVGAVGFRLLIYMKSKNAKKFRRDEEYGSARWGTEKDIKPFVDPKFENNVILTKTEFLTIDEICALPVADLAAPDSVLFLWATFPQLPEALRLIKAWGFQYKSVAFVWLKKNRKSENWFYGLGFWTRGNAEVCLLATRGHPKRQAANVHQFIIAPIQEHSRKPDEARDKIVALMGDVPRVELFARQSPPGWDVWGNEVESTVPDFWTKCPEVGAKGG